MNFSNFYKFIKSTTQSLECLYFKDTMLNMFTKNYLKNLPAPSRQFDKAVFSVLELTQNPKMVDFAVKNHCLTQVGLKNFFDNLRYAPKTCLTSFVLDSGQYFLETALNQNAFTKRTFQSFFNSLDWIRLSSFYIHGQKVFVQSLSNNLLDFNSIINTLAKKDILHYFSRYFFTEQSLVEFEKEFEKLFVSSDRLKRYLLNLENPDSVHSALDNNYFIWFLVSNCILDSEIVDFLSSRISYKIDDFSNDRILCHSNLFDYLDWHILHHYDANTSKIEGKEKLSELDKKILKFVDLNRLIYKLDFSIDQKRTLLSIISQSEVAQNRLSRITSNHLEANFDFDELMQYLKKTEKKNLFNI